MKVSSWATLAIAGVFACSAEAGVGPVSEYYLVSGDQDQIDVVQGLNIINTWAMAYGFEYAVAVDSTVRTLAANGGLGGEYSLAGVPTGNTYPWPGFTTWDSTTDGEHNYLVSWGGNEVYVTNADYSAPSVMYSLPANDWLGITYDPTNNSLWLAAHSGGDVINVDMGGNILSAFNTGLGNQAALALDHADGSLWLVEWTQNGDFYQFDKSGNLLSTAHYAGLVGVNPLGGEFAIPGPAALPLLAAGGLFATRRRRRE